MRPCDHHTHTERVGHELLPYFRELVRSVGLVTASHGPKHMNCVHCVEEYSTEQCHSHLRGRMARRYGRSGTERGGRKGVKGTPKTKLAQLHAVQISPNSPSEMPIITRLQTSPKLHPRTMPTISGTARSWGQRGWRRAVLRCTATAAASMAKKKRNCIPSGASLVQGMWGDAACEQ